MTADGECAEKKIYSIDQDMILNESQYDGFYAVYTNLDDDPADIAQINRGPVGNRGILPDYENRV